MEPRQGGRFHIWHMLGRGRCLFATYALRKTVLSSARTARLNGLRGFGASTRVRDIFGAGNHYSAVLNGSADVYTGKASEFVDKMNSKTRELCSDRDTTAQFQKTKHTKTPVAMGRGY